ncbi:MAG TPA: long-chain fatty acid--CoA ligase [Kofleriaceae bacterium]|jgi:fatty-acyl-CoA synthase|nr:long-chain fatty acid--CoA ligase [Kofleriaceae bacterium]
MGTQHLQFWPQVPRHLTIPETSLWVNAEISATRFPHKPCLNFYDSILTYAEFRREAERLAGYLQTVCGVRRGDRVGLYLQNSPQFVIGYYAILRADAMVVPLNPMLLTKEIEHIMTDSGARTLIVAQDQLARVEPLLGASVAQLIVAAYSDYLTAPTDLDVPAWLAAPRQPVPDTAGVVAWSAALASGAPLGPHLATADDLCVMPYTSGTTGNPKGCIHRHRSVMFTAVAVPQWNRIYQDETALAVLPYFHVTGMQNSMNSPIYTGATIVLLPRWDRGVAAQMIRRYRATSISTVPTMIVDLLSSPDLPSYDLSSIRWLGGGGAAMPEAVAHKLQELCGLTFIEGYGLSETIAPTHINPPHRPKRQCLGIPIFDTDARVVNPDTMAELPVGEVGEIIVSGPQVFDGYWNNPEANAACFVELDGKRFFRTGDLGRTDDEGYYFLVDRLKRMINVGGFKVWPAEVEAMLYAHPAIQEAVIIARKDPRRGECVKAVVVLRPAARGEVDEAELLRWARDNMAAYKVPAVIEFVDALPKSATGKIQWRALQEQEQTG